MRQMVQPNKNCGQSIKAVPLMDATQRLSWGKAIPAPLIS